MAVRVFQSPPRILYGKGAIEMVGTEAARLGHTALVVTGRKSSKKAGMLDRVKSILEAAGICTVVFDAVDSDPAAQSVEAGAIYAREQGVDLIVALGGGSPLDAAKGIAILLKNSGSIADYEKKAPAFAGAPIIAIPTTAGTGSEVSRFTVITDTERNVKMLIAADTIIPRVAILDPDLTLSLPPDLTAATGMDALTHAIEAYISLKAQPMSEQFSLQAIRLIRENLIPAVQNGSNEKARENMLYGQMLAGLAFSNASTALVHAMSRPLGAWFHVPHGLANAILLPTVMRFNRFACPEKFVDIGRAMGENVDGLSVREAVFRTVHAIRELAGETGLPQKLCMVGVSREAIPKLAADAFASGSTLCNPRMPTLAEIEELYESIYE